MRYPPQNRRASGDGHSASAVTGAIDPEPRIRDRGIAMTTASGNGSVFGASSPRMLGSRTRS